jgi:hypothetical protein
MPPPRQSVEGRGPTGLNRTRKGQGLTATAGPRRPNGDPTKGLETEGKTPHRNAGHPLPPGLALPTPRFVGLRVGTAEIYIVLWMQDTGCMMQDQDANPGMRVGLGPRCSVLGHARMRGRGDATFPRPSSRPRAENRRPDTESGTQYRSPVFEKPPMRYA